MNHVLINYCPQLCFHNKPPKTQELKTMHLLPFSLDLQIDLCGFGRSWTLLVWQAGNGPLKMSGPEIL